MNYTEETKFRYLTETSRALRNAGFDVEPQEDGSLSVRFEDKPLCSVPKPGGVTYRQENLTAPVMEQAKDRAFEIVKMVSEYMRAMDRSPTVKAAGLTNNYKALADFNETLFAATETRFGVQFVTWDWDFNREGLSHGHYFGNDYEAAKQDFATRSHLIDQNRLFTPEQTIEIYRCCADTLDAGLDLTYEQEKNIKSVQAQIENGMPDIMERIRQQDQRSDLTAAQGLSM